MRRGSVMESRWVVGFRVILDVSRRLHISEMPFRVVVDGTVASPNLPACKGILALRHTHTTIKQTTNRWIRFK